MINSKKTEIDLLVTKFWEKGYIVTKRKFGTYLDNPTKIGEYDIDAFGKMGNKYAFGFLLTEEDLVKDSTIEKINFLANVKYYSSSNKVSLIIGVPRVGYAKFKQKLSVMGHFKEANVFLFALEQGPTAMYFAGIGSNNAAAQPLHRLKKTI